MGTQDAAAEGASTRLAKTTTPKMTRGWSSIKPYTPLAASLSPLEWGGRDLLLLPRRLPRPVRARAQPGAVIPYGGITRKEQRHEREDLHRPGHELWPLRAGRQLRASGGRRR